MTEKSEEITERFNEKQYIIRVKHASNEKKQYRFFFICEKCNHRERLSNKTLFDINNHKCIKTQEKITTYSQYSPSPLTEAQIRLICKLNISFRAGWRWKQNSTKILSFMTLLFLRILSWDTLPSQQVPLVAKDFSIARISICLHSELQWAKKQQLQELHLVVNNSNFGSKLILFWINSA